MGILKWFLAYATQPSDTSYRKSYRDSSGWAYSVSRVLPLWQSVLADYVWIFPLGLIKI